MWLNMRYMLKKKYIQPTVTENRYRIPQNGGFVFTLFDFLLFLANAHFFSNSKPCIFFYKI